MRTYFARLWAALRGRQFMPLEMGDKFSFRSPGGTPLHVEVVQVSYHQDIDRASVLTIEAMQPVHRLTVH